MLLITQVANPVPISICTELDSERINPVGMNVQLKTSSTRGPTFFLGQVSEIHRVTDFLVRGPPQLHLHSHRLNYVSVKGWGSKDNGHLAVHVSLWENSLGFPFIHEKPDFYVIWKTPCRELSCIKEKRIRQLVSILLSILMYFTTIFWGQLRTWESNLLKEPRKLRDGTGIQKGHNI